MARNTFFCIDAHTCGNPVRVVTGGAPSLQGSTMSERRQHFMAEFDWIRTGLMFEPRGHDMMSGSILYDPIRKDTDAALLFIETSGCLPMCGHGTIGTVVAVIEHGLVTPKTPGLLRLEVPAGVVEAEYREAHGIVESVRLRNVPAYLDAVDLSVEVPGFGPLSFDVAYGGNFYAIVDARGSFQSLDQLSASEILRLSPLVRQEINAKYAFVHPENPTIRGCSHVEWTGKPRDPRANGRNAVFYGDKAIDRSPCGTGTSARLAQLTAKGRLKKGDVFVHESIIGSLFTGRVEEEVEIGGRRGIVPSIEGWARVTGFNTIFIDDRDPYAHGFQVQ
jgi:4-hydroxyproline epimerase